MKKNKILVFGCFGFKENQLDGQTIKTRNILDLLKTKGSDDFDKIEYFDTNSFRRNKWSIFSFFLKLTRFDVLLYLPAHNNLKLFSPLIFIISLIAKIDIHYIVIGGWLVEFLKRKPFYKFFLRKIAGIYPENELVKEKLELDYGFRNILVLHNFRIHKCETKIIPVGIEIKIIFMARIDPMKGIESIFSLGEELIKKKVHNVKIDLYGPILKDFEHSFLRSIEISKNVKYKGLIQPDNINTILGKYDFMILPTKYFTEGFPGSILDAYISGIPVVVSEWQHAREFVDHNETGLIFEFDNESEFIDRVMELILNPNQIERMKLGALKKSKQYQAEAAWQLLKNRLI